MLKTTSTKSQLKLEIKNYKQNLKLKNEEDKQESVYVIRFNGDIKATAVSSLSKEITAVLLVAKTKDRVVLILESSGGTINGYGLAASELGRLKKQGIKLVVIIDHVAASGGYMMACIANEIIASPFAIIGSIGVISQIPNFYQLLKKYGIKYEQITSGKFKKTLTMFGDNTEEDRKKVEQELSIIHNQFKYLVSKQRPNIDIESISTGEYWLGEKAKELKLVDKLMTSSEYLMNLCNSNINVYQVEYKSKSTFINKFSIFMNYIEQCLCAKKL